MNHQGDALRALLKKEGVTLSELSRRMHVHANTITNYVQSAEIKLDIWRQIGDALKKDLADLLPELAPFRYTEPAATAEVGGTMTLPSTKVPETLSSCQKELLRMQSAYITLMQEHLELVRRTSTAPTATV